MYLISLNKKQKILFYTVIVVQLLCIFFLIKRNSYFFFFNIFNNNYCIPDYLQNNNSIIEHLQNNNNTPTKYKYICLYAYYEKDDLYKNNLIYFLINGILENTDYYIIINGLCSVNIPERQNITIIKRENKGFDFGAWSYFINNYLFKKYKYYIFLNTSVRGPYGNNKNWLDEFLKLFNNDEIKLVGTSINIWSDIKLKNIFKYEGPYTHVQSMFFILNNDGFEFLKNNKFFDEEEFLLLEDIIINKEIKMSQLILKNNWNINCILSKYKNYDYRKVTYNFNFTGEDPYYENAYFGETIKKEEVIFYKNNR
jgi:hypothetical protein